MAKRKAETESKSVKKPTKTQPEVSYTLCVPSTVISSSNAKNLEQITSIAYQIARTATIYNVGEIVVLDVPSLAQREAILEKESKVVVLGSTDKGGKKIKFNDDMADVVGKPTPKEEDIEDIEPEQDMPAGSSITKDIPNENSAMLVATLLQYFITPPYLANSLFASSEFKNKLKYAKNLPKISTLPFMSNNDVWKNYREGLTIPKHTPKVVTKSKKKISPKNKLSTTKYVNVGLAQPLEISTGEVPVNVRVTVDLKNKTIVSPAEAYGVIGNKSSFGYHVRVSKSFTSIFTESTVPDGYSSSIYVNCDNYFGKETGTELAEFDRGNIHVKGGNVLLILGNWLDIEYSFSREKGNLEGVESADQMFDGELKVPDGVKIEDAALISLTKVYDSK
ncbi:putative methyltransferase [[Candida] railenensis]|uniref:Methyltransferase n=1 Tax=[Candida] railenensis TaxID=45579 RepID=A0A9P0QV36_9ASCO|nr:putative methyltransferase [[Candida] railenensis]